MVLLHTLRQCNLFADMPAADLERVAATCELLRYEKGEYLFHHGERARGFFIVQSGTVNIHRLSPDGHEHIIALFKPHECFAEVVLTSMESYPANAVALEATQVVLVRKAEFCGLIMAQPELALRMLTSMSMHLKYLLQMMDDRKFKRVESRLAHHLLRHCTRGGNGAPCVQLDSSKKVLAGRLGVSSETLSRAFARFKEKQLIEVNGSVISLLNTEGLKEWLME